MSHFDCDETDVAVRLYHRWCDRQGYTADQRDQPSRSQSGREGDSIVLRTGDRVLARYRVKPGGGLLRVAS